MQSITKSAAVPHSTGTELLRAISFTVLVLMVLAWSSAAATVRCNAAISDPADTPAADWDATAVKGSPETAGTDTETVTMSIPLEEGAVIDVEAPPRGARRNHPFAAKPIALSNNRLPIPFPRISSATTSSPMKPLVR